MNSTNYDRFTFTLKVTQIGEDLGLILNDAVPFYAMTSNV